MFRFNKKNYSLYSGERQTAADISGIRADHTARYEFCAEFLKSLHCKIYMKGLDCFCGNGYGSAILADYLPDIAIDSIDASEEAINFAVKFYYRDNIQYMRKCFPFKLVSNYDFIVSFESIEHISQDIMLLKEFHKALNNGGYLFLSTPNEKFMPYNRKNFPFHIKHYTPEELKKILKKCRFEIIRVMSQKSKHEPELIDGWDGKYNILICKKV